MGILPLDIIFGKTDGLESQRNNSPLHTSNTAVTGLFYNPLSTCLPPPLGHECPSWAGPYLSASVSLASRAPHLVLLNKCMAFFRMTVTSPCPLFR